MILEINTRVDTELLAVPLDACAKYGIPCEHCHIRVAHCYRMIGPKQVKVCLLCYELPDRVFHIQ